jgi:anti-sigma regulatory factor (Ser/Thr protein kinase)
MEAHEPRPGSARLRLRLAPDIHAPATARRALRELPLGERENDVLLLASELVTNAVLHAGLSPDQPIELEAACDRDRARVEVRDRGGGFARFPEAGNGLRIVAGATDRWGVAQDEATRVWFELSR